MIKLIHNVKLQLAGGTILLGLVFYALVNLIHHEVDRTDLAPKAPHLAGENAPEVVRKDVAYQ